MNRIGLTVLLFAMAALVIRLGCHQRTLATPEPRKSDSEPEPAEKETTPMASAKQRAAARRNIKKASAAARRQRTLTKLPKKTRTALGKEAAKARRRRAA